VAAYLVTGKERALIDMGYRSSVETILDDLSSAGVYTIDYLLPTHVHLDHAGSCGTLATRFPEAAVFAHPVGERHLVDPAQLIEDVRTLFGDLMHEYGLPEPIASKRIHSLNDDELIHLGNGLTLRSIWTLGHASHHLSFLAEETGSVFTGDAVGAYCPDLPVLYPQTPPPSFNMDKALSSICKLRALSPSELYTPHFGRLKHPEFWLERNEQVLLEWNATIRRLKGQGMVTELLAKELIRQVCMQIGKTPEELSLHHRTVIRINAIGFTRWIHFTSHN
jgi:glyoxylase-like metal-dependent hydrolase (beta-lactamase superfamily II)